MPGTGATLTHGTRFQHRAACGAPRRWFPQPAVELSPTGAQDFFPPVKRRTAASAPSPAMNQVLGAPPPPPGPPEAPPDEPPELLPLDVLAVRATVATMES